MASAACCSHCCCVHGGFSVSSKDTADRQQLANPGKCHVITNERKCSGSWSGHSRCETSSLSHAADAEARANAVLAAATRYKDIPLLPPAVAETVQKTCSCPCWNHAGVPVSQRTFYCCLCAHQRMRDGCVFWASPWHSSYRTFAAFCSSEAAGIQKAAAVHEQHQKLPGHETRQQRQPQDQVPRSPSSSSEQQKSRASPVRARFCGLVRRSVPWLLLAWFVYLGATATGPLPQVMFLLAVALSCIPVISAVSAVTCVRLETLTVIGGVGVQLDRRRLLSTSRRFVPMSQVRDVLITEAVHIYRVRYHVAIVLSGDEQIVVPFEGFPLRLEDCLAVYEALHYLLRTQIRGAAKQQLKN